MSENSKTNHMIKLFTEKSNEKHATRKNEMKRLSSDLDLMQALDNNDILHDCMLDLKSFMVDTLFMIIFGMLLMKLFKNRPLQKKSRM